jgi:hypothetical protein
MVTEKKSPLNESFNKKACEIIDSFMPHPYLTKDNFDKIQAHAKKITTKLKKELGKDVEITEVIHDETYSPPYSLEWKIGQK